MTALHRLATPTLWAATFTSGVLLGHWLHGCYDRARRNAAVRRQRGLASVTALYPKSNVVPRGRAS